jgi:hypothetical protein
VATNTKEAARQIAQKDPSWLSALRRRLLDQTDFSNASSALGEIRAYGALLETWMTVKPQPQVPEKKVVPEFEVDAGDRSVIVEVHSRQLDEDDVEAAAEHHKELISRHQKAVQKEEAAESGKPVVTFEERSVAPFGAPKPDKKGDSILTNAISRIARIKDNEKQVDATKPFLLWLDFQDPIVWGYMSVSGEQLAPLYSESKDGEVSSGALWFALYGRKGGPDDRNGRFHVPGPHDAPRRSLFSGYETRWTHARIRGGVFHAVLNRSDGKSFCNPAASSILSR